MLLLLPFMAMAGSVCAPQSDQSQLCLDQPAQRVISLAPHLTESLFAVGAGERVVGAVEYSDYPPAATELPTVGGYRGLDLEAIVRLEPDLIVAWAQGGGRAQLEKLESMGFAVWHSQGEKLADVPLLLRGLGTLTGEVAQAEQQAGRYERQLATLEQRYRQQSTLSGFFEIWPVPLTTVTPEHYIGQALALCGVENIVSHQGNTTPHYSTEAVIKAAPQLLITTEPARDFHRWRNWPEIPAIAHDGMIILPPDLLERIGPRLVDGVAALCQAVDTIRTRRFSGSGGRDEQGEEDRLFFRSFADNSGDYLTKRTGKRGGSSIGAVGPSQVRQASGQGN